MQSVQFNAVQRKRHMKILSRNSILAILLSSSLSLGSHLTAEDKAPPSDTRGVSDVVQDLGLAAQLAAYGRGELNELTGLKDFKSPEALVAAGGITLRAHKETAGKIRPSGAEVTEEGKAVEEKEIETSLESDADALFSEAYEMAADKKAIESTIKQAKLITTRGAVGGPRVINRTINSGRTQNIKIEFESNSSASVAMRGTGKTKFEVIGANGNVLWHSQGSFGTYTWHVGGKNARRDITVRVINSKGPQVAYTIITN